MSLQLVNRTLRSAISHMRKVVESTEFVKCPSCSGEWTKLHPCTYFYFHENGNRKTDTTFMCVECAESVRGLMFCSHTWPSVNARAHVFWPNDFMQSWYDTDAVDHQTGKLYKERVMIWSRLQGSVKGNGFDAMVRIGKHPSQIAVYETGKEEPYIFDNIVCAWHWMKRKIDTPKEVLDEQDSFQRF